MKMCGTCKELKALSEFHPSYGKDRRPGTVNNRCKVCANAASKLNYAKNKDKYKVTRDKRRADNPNQSIDDKRKTLASLYNITLEEFNEMAKNGCHACGSFNRLSVDHDHTCCAGNKSCGRCIRGILCHNCNVAEGFLESSIDRVIALASYMIICQSGVKI